MTSTRRTNVRTMLQPRLLSALFLLLIGACDVTQDPLSPLLEHGRPSATKQSDEPGQRLAQAFALALKRPEVRVNVRNAMRDARYNEHKLVLQEYVNTREGRGLVEVAAQATGTTPATIRTWIGQLPAMDFYMPLPEHRRSWRATENLVVGLNLDVDETRLTGYGPDGSVLHLDRRDGIPARAVLIMHPAEPKYVRSDVVQRTQEVIEPNALDIARSYQPCPDCGGGGSFSPVLYQFRPYVYDGWGDLELSFKHYNSLNTKVWEWITSSVNWGELRTPNRSTIMGAKVVVSERDSGFPEVTGDDPMGEAFPAPTNQVTAVYAACGPLNDDSGDPYAHCINDYGVNPLYSNTEIWYTMIHTIDIVYRY